MSSTPTRKDTSIIPRDILREALIAAGANPDAIPKIVLTEEHKAHQKLALASQAKMEEENKALFAEPGSFQKYAAEQFDRIKAAAEGGGQN
jgi:hypothetical protein